MVLVETSKGWEILRDIYIHNEPLKIFDLDLTNQVEFYLFSVVLPSAKVQKFSQIWLLIIKFPVSVIAGYEF